METKEGLESAGVDFWPPDSVVKLWKQNQNSNGDWYALFANSIRY